MEINHLRLFLSFGIATLGVTLETMYHSIILLLLQGLYSDRLHGVATQNMTTHAFTAMKTANLKHDIVYSNYKRQRI
jgi:hypothetical protein